MAFNINYVRLSFDIFKFTIKSLFIVALCLFMYSCLFCPRKTESTTFVPKATEHSDRVYFQGNCGLYGMFCWMEVSHWHDAKCYETLLTATPAVTVRIEEGDEKFGCFIAQIGLF